MINKYLDLFTYEGACSSEVCITEFEGCTLLKDIGLLKEGSKGSIVIDILHNQFRMWIEDDELKVYPILIVVDATKEVKPYWEI